MKGWIFVELLLEAVVFVSLYWLYNYIFPLISASFMPLFTLLFILLSLFMGLLVLLGMAPRTRRRRVRHTHYVCQEFTHAQS